MYLSPRAGREAQNQLSFCVNDGKIFRCSISDVSLADKVYDYANNILSPAPSTGQYEKRHASCPVLTENYQMLNEKTTIFSWLRGMCLTGVCVGYLT